MLITNHELVLCPPPGEIVRLTLDEIVFVREALADGANLLIRKAIARHPHRYL